MSEKIYAMHAEPGQIIDWNGRALTVASVDAKSDGWVVIHPTVGHAVYVAPGGEVTVTGRAA